MITTSWKKFSILSISAVIIGLIGTSVVIACAGGDYEEYMNSFFAPEISKADRYQPFYSSPSTFYKGFYKEDYIQQFDTINVEEWNAFFNNKVAENDLYYLLYKARLGEIDTLIFYVKDTKYPIKPYLKSNSIANYADKVASKEFLFFLGFAKRCSQVSTNIIEWGDEQARISDSRKVAGELLKGGLKLTRNVKNKFIKERYFFQLTRLYFFSGTYEACTDYCLARVDSFSLCKSMKYRSLSYAAGAAKGQDIRQELTICILLFMISTIL